MLKCRGFVLFHIACYHIAEHLHTKNLGQFENPPTFDEKTNTTKVEYTNGDSCGNNKKIQSSVTFICKPGAV